VKIAVTTNRLKLSGRFKSAHAIIEKVEQFKRLVGATKVKIEARPFGSTYHDVLSWRERGVKDDVIPLVELHNGRRDPALCKLEDIERIQVTATERWGDE
jgi:hypothetical protein